MTTNIAKEFGRIYLRFVLKTMAVMVGILLISFVGTFLLAFPLFVGIYIELGVVPWDIFAAVFNPSAAHEGEISQIYYYLIPVWWVFGLGAFYSAAKTVETSMGEK